MTVSYSNYGYYPRNPRKEVGTDIVLGTAAGAVGIGLANAGEQKLILKYPDKIPKKIISEGMLDFNSFYFMGEPLTPESKAYLSVLDVLREGKINWLKAGKAALVGGAAVGVLTGLISAIKKLPKSQ